MARGTLFVYSKGWWHLGRVEENKFLPTKYPLSFVANGMIDYRVKLQNCSFFYVCPEEIIRTICSGIVLVIMIIIMTSAQIYSDHAYGEYVLEFETAIRKQDGLFPPANVPYYAQIPLHDRGFTVFPDLTPMRSWLPDMLLTSLLATTLLFNIFWIHKPRMEYQGFVVARRMIWMLATLYFFRTWSFLVTTVPSPLRGCTGKYLPEDMTPSEMVPGYIKLIGQMATGSVTACTDNIYSGHTSLITILVMTFIMYSGVNLLKIYASIHGACALLAILITRLHYTVDIYIALLVASFVFLNYHFLLLIFLQARLERCHAMKDRFLAQFASKRTAGPEMYIKPNQVDFNRQLFRQQTDLDMDWLRDEKRIVMRVLWSSFGRTIWWMDGMDLRRPELDVPAVADMFSNAESDEKLREAIEPESYTSIPVETDEKFNL